MFETGTGVTDLTIDDVAVSDTTICGNAANAAYSRWTIMNSTVDSRQDQGVILEGADMTV